MTFDRIDHRHRRKEIRLDTPSEEGDVCPDPKCGGKFTWFGTGAARPIKLMCYKCYKEAPNPQGKPKVIGK